MSKPLKIPAAEKEKILKDFEAYLDRAKLEKGKLSYEQDFKLDQTEKPTATLRFTKDAWIKQCYAVNTVETEIAWHGLADRVEEGVYRVKDVFVFPQTVNGIHVDTDLDAYSEWLDKFDEESYNQICFQAHSHVDMSPEPSGTDMEHRGRIAAQIAKDSFYIFMITNKRMERTVEIYDMQSGILYEDGDVSIEIEDMDIDSFMNEICENVKREKYYSGKLSSIGTAGSLTISEQKVSSIASLDDDDDDLYDEYAPKSNPKKKSKKGGSQYYDAGKWWEKWT